MGGDKARDETLPGAYNKWIVWVPIANCLNKDNLLGILSSYPRELPLQVATKHRVGCDRTRCFGCSVQACGIVCSAAMSWSRRSTVRSSCGRSSPPSQSPQDGPLRAGLSGFGSANYGASTAHKGAHKNQLWFKTKSPKLGSALWHASFRSTCAPAPLACPAIAIRKQRIAHTQILVLFN